MQYVREKGMRKKVHVHCIIIYTYMYIYTCICADIHVHLLVRSLFPESWRLEGYNILSNILCRCMYIHV